MSKPPLIFHLYSSDPHFPTTRHHPWSRPHTLIRRLTTKFNPRIHSPSPAVPRVPSAPSAFNKQSREAALRERGLLPPLRPNKDLSAQEEEQDRVIPIVLLKDDHRGSTESAAPSPSAADLVKKEWEAKNRSRAAGSDQLQRMNSFEFGEKKAFVPSSPIIQFSSSESADSAILDTQALSSLAEVAVSHLPPSTFKVPLAQPAEPISRPATPLLDIPPEITAYLFSLPPSPRSVSGPKFELSFCPASPTSVPLPTSPSLRSATSVSGARTPGPLDIQETSLTPTPTPSVTALTPCAVDTASFPPHKRTDLSAAPDESASSSLAPSLDSNSRTTTDSTLELGTCESVAISGKGRLGGLKIKSHEESHYNIPVIVESPVEDSFSEEYIVVKSTSISDGKPMTPINAMFTSNATRMNVRGVTDPTNGNLNRKKSMISNPFKRGLTCEDQSTSSGQPQRRLTMKASFSNLGRNVVGTLSRRTSRDRVGAVSRPSPPIFTGISPAEDGEVRRAVSPILYSRGHILMEASHIKDAESRRVTEMAFLT